VARTNRTPRDPGPDAHAWLRANLRFDPSTGWLIWLTNTSRGRQSSRLGLRAGHIHILNPAYTPYLRREIGTPFGNLAECHIAHFLQLGFWPPKEMDHADRDSTNNKWGNLTHPDDSPRYSNPSQQQQNTGRSRRNATGRKGVSIHRGKPTARAQDPATGKQVHLGYFLTIEEASAAYRAFCEAHHDPRFRYNE
jgi:hypothetical protein